MGFGREINRVFNIIGGKQNALLALICILIVSIAFIHFNTVQQTPIHTITHVTQSSPVHGQQIQQEIPEFKVWGLPIVDTRNDFGILLESENKKVGLEIGVQRGIYSEIILSKWINCEKYILMDPWVHQQNYEDVANVNQDTQNALYDETVNRLKKFQERGTTLEYIRDFSGNGRKLIPDNSLDFVYIDARHDYKAMNEDLSWFWPKLKVGGIFAGHDFVNADEEPKIENNQDWCVFDDGERCENNKAVKAAVEEFAIKHGKQVVVPRRETKWVSWYLRK